MVGDMPAYFLCPGSGKQAGYRVIAMDHIGMGRSDKPVDLEYHSFLNHARRLEAFITALELRNISAFVQD